eukprot:gb/GECG01014962.1/.p1 GENE.gb/GECG01014962.1/~~gb/GECG01014962.1/.p1  ORF type:complete len:124 (+),score=16.88 gb/GECG01014962.1/:1-372(+)
MQDIELNDGFTYLPGEYKEQEETWEVRDWLANAKEVCPDSSERSVATGTSGSNPNEPDAQQNDSKPDVSGLTPREKRRVWNRENARKSRERKKLMVIPCDTQYKARGSLHDCFLPSRYRFTGC